MKCPHCSAETSVEDSNTTYLGEDIDGDWFIKQYKCHNPECKRLILYLEVGHAGIHCWGLGQAGKSVLIHPEGLDIPKLPPEVPPVFSEQFYEAFFVLKYSPRASVALSRMCLQYLLRQVARVNPGKLGNEVQQVLDSGKLPASIVQYINNLQANSSFFRLENQDCNVIHSADSLEAELYIKVLSQLFEYYFLP